MRAHECSLTLVWPLQQLGAILAGLRAQWVIVYLSDVLQAMQGGNDDGQDLNLQLGISNLFLIQNHSLRDGLICLVLQTTVVCYRPSLQVHPKHLLRDVSCNLLQDVQHILQHFAGGSATLLTLLVHIVDLHRQLQVAKDHRDQGVLEPFCATGPKLLPCSRIHLEQDIRVVIVQQMHQTRHEVLLFCKLSLINVKVIKGWLVWLILDQR
mmetsp:Transcript_69315/g.122365  ORF Transcript_69315/g.122365 Transcript_69315/m.122365 type:complete len:210 (+) Transcript_69315:1485-2114(+)